MNSPPPRRPRRLGVVDGRLAPCSGSPNCVSSQSSGAPHEIEPIAFDGDPGVALGRLATLLEQMAGAVIVQRDERYLHAEFTSRILRFIDDLELWVDIRNRQVQVRSASRVGYSDLGANRRRVEALRQAFAAQ